MSIQVSKFEINEENNDPRTSHVAQFFNDSIPHKISPIQKIVPAVDYINITPQVDSVKDAGDCNCKNTFSKIRDLLQAAEKTVKSRIQVTKQQEIADFTLQNQKLLCLVIANKKTATNLMVLFMKRMIKNRKLSALAKIFSRFKQKKNKTAERRSSSAVNIY